MRSFVEEQAAPYMAGIHPCSRGLFDTNALIRRRGGRLLEQLRINWRR
ncbi:hypothetical protein ABIC11_004373 [Pseudomonas oryzihabitans]